MKNIETRISPLNFEEIVFLKAEKNYTHFYFLSGTSLKLTYNLGAFEKTLIDKKNFIRVHTSYIINSNYLDKNHSDIGYLKLKGGETVPVGRIFKHKIENFKFSK